jgi:hypothetical protein
MNEGAKRGLDRALAWTGPIFVVAMIYFWGIKSHNIPPPNFMAMTPDQLIAEYYGKYPEIGPAMIGVATFGMFYTTWSCLIASIMRDENGQMGPLSFLELSGGILTGWLFAFTGAIWAACSLLAGTIDPGIIKMVHTFTWFIFDCTYMITTIQMFGLGLWTVLNKKQQIVPAWVGWGAMAIGTAFIPLVFMPFVTEGPFAVNGMWNFWIIFITWLFVFFAAYNYFVLRHVYRSPDEQRRALGLPVAA